MLLLTVFFVLNYSCHTSQSSRTSGNNSKLIGVWKNVSPGQNGEMIKFITKDHFVWTWSFDNKVMASAGGIYEFDGETYTETLEYGTENQNNFIGKKAIVKITFEGNNKFHYSGMLAGRMPLNEVWERIE